MAFDPAPLNAKELRKDPEDFIQGLTTSVTQVRGDDPNTTAIACGRCLRRSIPLD